MTYTYVSLPISQAAYDEIAGKLRDAGYHHCFELETIDMHGLALVAEKPDGVEALLGSDWQPSQVTILEGYVAPLGDVVRFAFARCGVTVKQWNDLPCRVREVLLIEAVTTMQEEARAE